MKKIANQINIMLLGIILVLSTFLIGTPISERNVQIVYILSGIFCACYFGKQLYLQRKNTKSSCNYEKLSLINNKLDLCVVILVFSTAIPLIFRTYVSLDATVHMLLKYICYLGLYVIAKNECRKESKNVDIFLNMIIISIVALCVIGLDEINKDYLKDFKLFFHYTYVEYDEVRVVSLFSYPNTMAAIAGLGIFLCLGNFFKTSKKWLKLWYGFAGFILFITMIMTYSRLVYILFAVTCVFWGLVFYKKYKIREKINKKIGLFLSLAGLLAIFYILIGLQIPQKLVIKQKYQKILYSVEKDTDYSFVLDINSVTDEENGVTIRLSEKNEFFDDVGKTEWNFGTFSGEKEIKIHTRKRYSSYVFEYRT